MTKTQTHRFFPYHNVRACKQSTTSYEIAILGGCGLIQVKIGLFLIRHIRKTHFDPG